jgi:hypothetical protein
MSFQKLTHPKHEFHAWTRRRSRTSYSRSSISINYVSSHSLSKFWGISNCGAILSRPHDPEVSSYEAHVGGEALYIGGPGWRFAPDFPKAWRNFEVIFRCGDYSKYFLGVRGLFFGWEGSRGAGINRIAGFIRSAGIIRSFAVLVLIFTVSLCRGSCARSVTCYCIWTVDYKLALRRNESIACGVLWQF